MLTQREFTQIKECESEEDISRINDQLSESSVQTALKSSGSTQRNTVPPVENVAVRVIILPPGGTALSRFFVFAVANHFPFTAALSRPSC